MQNPENKNTPKISMLAEVPSDKALNLEAIDLLTQFNTCNHSAITKKQAEISIQQWKSQSQEHHDAWQAAEEMWLIMGNMKASVFVEAQTKPVVVAQKKYWRKCLIPTSIAACFVLAFTFLNEDRFITPTDTAHFSPKKVSHIIEKEYTNYWQAEHRVLLPDNSLVHLNFNSTIKISFNHSVRHVELIQGEAFFKVAKDPKKPFIVKVGDNTASALGTAFIVRRETDNTSLITVTEGVVEVALLPDQQLKSSPATQEVSGKLIAQSSILLNANESVIASGNVLGVKQKTPKNNVGSWHRGVLIFKDKELYEVLAEINRYTAYDITANLGYRHKEKITGTFFINRLDQELSALITSLNLNVVKSEKGKLVLGLSRPKLRAYSP
jgi:transmembrane sensor